MKHPVAAIVKTDRVDTIVQGMQSHRTMLSIDAQSLNRTVAGSDINSGDVA